MPAPVAAAAAARAAGGATTRAAAAGGARRGAAGAGARRARPGARRGAAGAVEAPTASDDRALRAELGQRDRAYEAAYEAGLAGEALGDEADEATRQAHAAGAGERRRVARARNVDRARAALPSGAGGLASDGAGFLLGLLVYALGLNYLQGGVPQTRGWIAAKFLNKPYRQPSKARGTRPR